MLQSLAAGIACLLALAEPPTAGPYAEPKPVRLGPRTTAPETAWKGLDAQIDGLRDAMRHAPAQAEFRIQLAESLVARTVFAGSYADFDEAMGVLDPKPAVHDLELARASLLSSLHRFGDAGKLVRQHGKGSPRAEELLSNLDLANERNLPAVVERRRKAAEKTRTYASLVSLAAAVGATGDFEGADDLYVEALRVHRDVSPFPYAWVAFQRGVMWAEVAGDARRAVPLYREALRRLPGYVVATVHLAELEAEFGERTAAIGRLQDVLTKTQDPEPYGLLSELLAESEPKRAAELVAEAKRRYEVLLERHGPAFWDHAAEFFSGPGGDPRRALDLATRNLKNRPTQRARLVAIGAAHAAKDRAALCKLVRKAPAVVTSRPLADALAEHRPTCK